VWDEVPGAWVRRKIAADMGEFRKPPWVDNVLTQLHTDLWVDEARIRPAGLYLCLKNGMWDVEKYELLEHSPRFMARYQLPVRYEPDAECPLWEQTLKQIFADDEGKIEVLRSFFSYCLYPRILFPGVLFAIGGGGNGKGVVEHVLCGLLGNRAVSHLSLARMEDKFGCIELKDKLLNSCGETETGMMDVSKFKLVSAGDEIQAEVKYAGDVIFTPIAKHFISMNAFPSVAEKTKSFYRRVNVLEFKQSFDKRTADPLLKWKLEAELDGIFAWAMEGLEATMERGCLVETAGTCDASYKMRIQNNPLMIFVEEMCIVAPTAWIKSDGLYTAYREWAMEGGMKPMGRNKLYQALDLEYGVNHRRAGNSYILEGIGLRDQDQQG
jgi:putative DNA primase/helicase